MEGYLLALPKGRDAQLWFCALEHGVLRCYTKAGGALVDTVQLTRHSVRVVVQPDGACPNEFAVCAIAVHFDEDRAKLRLARDKERVHRFAAPTPEKMRKWGRAIQNWRRYAFVESTQDVDKQPAAAAARRAALREEAQTLISFVTSFDLRLKLAVAKPEAIDDKVHTKDNFPECRASLVSSTRHSSAGAAKADRLSLPTSRASQIASLASWIPVRMPTWRRMKSSPPQA